MAFPIAAALITGALGAIANTNSSRQAQQATHNAIQQAQGTLAQAQPYADELYANGQANLQDMRDAVTALYGNTADASANLKKAQEMVNGVNPYEASSFDYKKTLEDFYDPALQLRMNASNDAINGSQALGGSLFSSDTANKLTAQAQVLGSEAYKDAMNAYSQDKSLEQSIWQGNESAKQAQANSMANLAGMQYQMASDTAGNLSQANNDYYTALMGLDQDYYQNKTDYLSQLAGLQAQDPGEGPAWWQKILDPLGLFV